MIRHTLFFSTAAEVQLDASVAQFCENTEGPFDVCVFVRSGENSDCPVEFQTNYTISFTRLSGKCFIAALKRFWQTLVELLIYLCHAQR